MTLDSIIILATAVAALAIKPGPGRMTIMSRTIAHGMSACYAFMLAYLIVAQGYLIFVFVTFNIPGLDMVFITILLKTIAAAYLIWMGVKGLKDEQLKYTNVEDMAGHSFMDNFTAALVLSISNPLVIVFYAGILPSLLDMQTMSLNDMVIISAVVLAVEGIIPVLYCAPLALFRKKIPMDFLKGLRVFSSIIIIIVGLYIGYTTLPAVDILFVN